MFGIGPFWLADCCCQRQRVEIYWNLMLKLCRILRYLTWRECCSTRDISAIAGGARPCSRGGLAEMISGFCECYKGMSVSPGLSGAFLFMCLYRNLKLTGRIWTCAIIAIRRCKCNVFFLRHGCWFVRVCHYLCCLDPLQIGPSQCCNEEVDWKHPQVSSGYLEMSWL